MTDNWQALLHPDIKNFIEEHQNSDVHDLALKKPSNPDWPYALILDQIKSRQKAAIKITSWLECENIIFPPPDTLEQASSTATAKYKASLFKGKSFIDLTGGVGVDSWAMAENFDHITVIESQDDIAAILSHNLNILSKKPFEVYNKAAEEFVKTMDPVDLVFIDPQRRNKNQKGLYELDDCSPNILKLLPQIKAKTILLKTSPMLDIAKAGEQLDCVKHVHVLEWQNECKELLFVLDKNKKSSDFLITATELDNEGNTQHSFSYRTNEEKQAELSISSPQNYLYEPGPAFMKAGGLKSLSEQYKIPKLAPSTHLYTSEYLIQNFPGRSFEIIDTYSPKAKSIPLKKANLKARNFPINTQALKKKLKIEDGGNEYLFACTIQDENTGKNSHKILHCHKKNI